MLIRSCTLSYKKMTFSPLHLYIFILSLVIKGYNDIDITSVTYKSVKFTVEFKTFIAVWHSTFLIS